MDGAKRIPEGEYARIRAVKLRVETTLLSKTNVVGVGIGLLPLEDEADSRFGIIVMVSQKVPRAHLAPADVIPMEIDGIPISVQEVGELKASDPGD